MPSILRPSPPLRAPVLALSFLLAASTQAQTLDPAFTPTFNDTVRAVAGQADGRLLVGGQFTGVSGQSRFGIARLDASGVPAAALPATPNDRVNAIVVQADGRIVIGGEFDAIGGAPHVYVARLTATGAVDPAFTSQIGNTSALGVTELAVQADGKVVIIGGFTTVSGQARGRIARLNANGSLDTGFNAPALPSLVDAMLLQPDGRVVIAGAFDSVSSACATYCVLRLSSTGVLDASFTVTPVLGTVRQLVRQADGRILVAGEFSSLGTQATYFIGRLAANGGPDTGFANTQLRYSDITRVVPLADGRFIIGGEIRWGTAGVTEDRIARLAANGSRDTTFNEPVLDSMIIAMAVQPDQQVIVGGMFTQVAGQPRGRLARFVVGERPDPVFGNGFE